MLSDYVLLSDIAIHAHHGAIPSENDLGQRFYITVRVELDTRDAARTDQVRDTVNYAEVYRIIHQLQGPRGVPASRRNPAWREEAAAAPGAEGEGRAVAVAPLADGEVTAPPAPPASHRMHRGPFQLIETLAHEAALGILARFPRAVAVEVHVRKPSVPIEGILGHAEIGVRRTRADLAGA